MILEQSFIDDVQQSLPELPEAKFSRFVTDYKLNEEDAVQLTSTRPIADYYEQVVDLTEADAKVSANWITGELFAALNNNDLEIQQSPVSTEQFATLLNRIADNTLSGKTAKQVFTALWNQEGQVDDIIDKKGLKQITDSGAIESIVDEVLTRCTEQVQQYKDGNEKVFGFLVGQVIQASKGKANPGQVNQLLKAKLNP